MSLPSGLVAFLLLDVEASTAGWNTSGRAMEAAVSCLDADVAAIVVAHGGSLIKARGEGDSHFAAFGRASSAVEAAAAVQRRSDGRLAVRAAVLIGEAEPRAGDYVGAIVNHSARIRTVAHGGQVLATRAVVDVCAGHLQAGLRFQSLGPHRLQDLPTSIELFQLQGRGLRRSFPPLRTPANDASALMAIAVVDEVGSARRYEEPDERLVEWQGTLIRSLRRLSERHDGRYLKLVGDGCIVGFEDPRAALAFAQEARDRMTVRIGIALGLVEVVEGELAGRVLFDAYSLMRSAAPNELRTCAVINAICGPRR